MRDLRRNLDIANLTNVDVIGGDAVREFPDEDADVLVVDPPRAGLAPEAIDLIASTSARDVAYVSCDPATLARDLRRFVDEAPSAPSGPRRSTCSPQTFHCETVCLLSREKSVKRYVHVDVTPEELGMRGKSKNVKHPDVPANRREYVKEKHGLTVSSANIASVKDECGMEKQFSYKEAGMAAKKRPNCPKKKRDAIVEAFVHFGMLSQSDAEALDA